jgi:hypothetical protein
MAVAWRFGAWVLLGMTPLYVTFVYFLETGGDVSQVGGGRGHGVCFVSGG